MIGRAAVEITRTLSVAPPSEATWPVTAVALLMLAVAWGILVRGSRGVRRLNRIAAPALLVLALWLLVAILQKVSLARLLAATPIAPEPDRAMNFMLVVELHITAGLTWYALAGNLARYARTPRSAVWGSWIAYVLVGTLSELAPAALYDHFYTLVAYLQAVFAPAAGIAFADRVVLRRGGVDVRALYATDGASPYHYWAGVNPAAFVALGGGAFTFLALFDPLAYTGTAVFEHGSASVPAFAAGALLHVVLTRWVVAPTGRGGHGAHR